MSRKRTFGIRDYAKQKKEAAARQTELFTAQAESPATETETEKEVTEAAGATEASETAIVPAEELERGQEWTASELLSALLKGELIIDRPNPLYEQVHQLVRNHHNYAIDHIRDIDAHIYNVDSLLLKLTAKVDAIRQKQGETTAAVQSLADGVAPTSKGKLNCKHTALPRPFYSRLWHNPWLRKFAILLLILTTILSVATTCIIAVDNNRLHERNRQLSITEDKLHTLREWAATDSVWRLRFNLVDMYYADPALHATDIRLLKRHIQLKNGKQTK